MPNRNARLLKRGDIINLPGAADQEVVRSITILAHMGNGQDIRFEDSDTVEVVDSTTHLSMRDLQEAGMSELVDNQSQEGTP